MIAISPALIGALQHLTLVVQSDALRCRTASLADAANRGDAAALKRELHGLFALVCIDGADWSEGFCATVLGTSLERQDPFDDAGASVARLYAKALGLVADEIARVASKAPGTPRPPAEVLPLRRAGQ